MTVIGLRVPFGVYDDAIAGSSVPAEEHWPEPTVIRGAFVYYGSHSLRERIVSHVLDVYECRRGYEEAARDRARLRPWLRSVGALPPAIPRMAR